MTNGQNHGAKTEQVFVGLGDKRKTIAWVIVGLFVIPFICMSITYSVWDNWRAGLDETSEAIGEFFNAMSHKRINPVVRLMSAEGKQNYPEETLKEMVNGDDFALFEGYQKFNILSRSNNSSFGRGRYKEIRGTVTYEKGFTGEFVFYFHKEYGKWKIADFEITIPPEKMEADQQAVKMGGQK